MLRIEADDVASAASGLRLEKGVLFLLLSYCLWDEGSIVVLEEEGGGVVVVLCASCSRVAGTEVALFIVGRQ